MTWDDLEFLWVQHNIGIADIEKMPGYENFEIADSIQGIQLDDEGREIFLRQEQQMIIDELNKEIPGYVVEEFKDPGPIKSRQGNFTKFQGEKLKYA